MLLLIAILIFICASLLVSALTMYLAILGKRVKSGQNPERTKRQPKDRVYDIDKSQIVVLFVVSPIIIALVAGLLVAKHLVVILAGGLLGLILPALWFKGAYKRRVRKFESQLPDSLMIMNSCLRGGLSLIQSIEVLTEEMPHPTNVEFNQLIKENKMGISLEESLHRLNQRLKSDDLLLLSSAITVSRETGGDLTEVITRLNGSIRERNKLLENVKTLTLQGKLQSVILTILPIVFAYTIYKINPGYLEVMINSQTGKMLLVIAGCLLFVGILLVRLFSKVEV